MGKHPGKSGSEEVYHREELGEEEERRSREEGVDVRDRKKIKNKGRWRGMKTKKSRERWTWGKRACKTLQKHTKMCEAEDKRSGI